MKNTSMISEGSKSAEVENIMRRVSADELSRSTTTIIPAEVFVDAQRIIDDVASRREAAAIEWAQKLGDITANSNISACNVSDGQLNNVVLMPETLVQAYEKLGAETQALLTRSAKRVESFALAQRAALSDIEEPILGGKAGHEVASVDVAGCYAPGGRFPLPSSVLMTAITARAAGVGQVWVASPKPTLETLAAAHVAGADGVLPIGGAQAIASLAYGCFGIPRADVIVGPGNRWVTAAKKILFGTVGIDMLAGPTELLILADESSNPVWVAADLLAQAEHDTAAMPVLASTSEDLLNAVDEALAIQLPKLTTRDVAIRGLENGRSVLAVDEDELIAICDEMAPEHLQIVTQNPTDLAKRCRHYGAVFIGEHSAEVIGDYCAGPNHTLPTGGTARYSAGLSVFDFLRIRTWIRIDDPSIATPLYRDAGALGDSEGLSGHAHAARIRIPRE